MNVLVACEFSGIVRDAFRARGHNAWSCDFLPSEGDNKYHIQDNIRAVLNTKIGYEWFPKWDLMIAHPPCTYLAVSGARWFSNRIKEQEDALDFIRFLMEVNIPRICIENPIGVISTKIRKPDQIIQPWMFGHGETKATCLWLKNLPLLTETNVVAGREPKVHFASPGPDRWKVRSRTYQGIADGMAAQWGKLL